MYPHEVLINKSIGEVVETIQTMVTAEKPEDLSTKIKLEAKLSISQVINNLITERKHWESNELTVSDRAKYGILQKCYNLHYSMNSLEVAATALKVAFQEYCDSQSPKIIGSHLMTQIVNAVFGMQDRRTSSAYSLVLRHALKKSWGVLEIPTKIIESGGIEAIRRNNSGNSKSQSDKVIAAKPALTGEVLASVKSENLSLLLNKASYKDAVILLATAEPNGEFHIRRLIQKESAVNAALASIYTTVTEEQKTLAARQQPANDANARDDAINVAVAA